MGKLQGLKLTAELRSAADAVLALPQPASEQKGAARDDNECASASDCASSSSSTSPRSMSASSPSALLEQARGARRALSQSKPTAGEARSSVEAALKSAGGGGEDVGQFLPLECVSALKFLVDNSRGTDAATREDLARQLERSVRNTALSFEPDRKKATNNPAFEKRLERLRLRDEERSYMNLTTNLKTAASLKDDNVTAKSMMYATSVGLNMVVAPISFGVFMYFFAGSIFSRFFDAPPEEGEDGDDAVDVRRVIAGVVSGVFMLFVEMILFVIRSHELDASVRKKSRRSENRANAFGYTQKAMERTYVGERD